MVEVWNGATTASTSTAYLAVEGDMGFDDPRIGVGVLVCGGDMTRKSNQT